MGSKAGQVPAPSYLRFFTSADSRVSSRPPGLRNGSGCDFASISNPERSSLADAYVARAAAATTRPKPTGRAIANH